MRSHAGELTAFARRLTMDHHQGEDVVQEALARCARRWRHRPPDNPRAYAYRAVINEANSWRRRRSAFALSGVELMDDDSHGIDVTVDVDSRDHMARALQVLTSKQRTVIVLRYYLDLSDVEIGSWTGWPVSTVGSHARRGLARLAADLRAQSSSEALL